MDVGGWTGPPYLEMVRHDNSAKGRLNFREAKLNTFPFQLVISQALVSPCSFDKMKGSSLWESVGKRQGTIVERREYSFLKASEFLLNQFMLIQVKCVGHKRIPKQDYVMQNMIVLLGLRIAA